MNRQAKIKMLSSLLAGALLLSGCGKKSDCEIPSRHVHRYTKQITDEIVLEEYIDSEKLRVHGFDWNSDYIEITKHDERLYQILNKKQLFYGIDNWDYLFNVMKNNHDYLEFYYEYETLETYTTTDSKGNIEVHTRTVTHNGWHTNANDSDNTGLTRLYHHRYVGYRIVNVNGEYRLEASQPVDDIREIIEEYPYFSEDCTTKVYEQFKFKRGELKHLRPEDFDTFEHPDLSNPQLILK